MGVKGLKITRGKEKGERVTISLDMMNINHAPLRQIIP